MSGDRGELRGDVRDARGGRGRPSIPDAERLAVLLSNVTVPLMGIAFEADRTSQAVGRTYGRSAIVWIPRPRALSLLLASDEDGARFMAGTLRPCAAGLLDPEQVDEALHELAGLTACQVEIAMRVGSLSVDGAQAVAREQNPHGYERKRVVLRSAWIEVVLVLWDSARFDGR